MGVTFWRWTAGVAFGCGALAVVLLPFPPVVPETWASAAPPQLAAEIRKLTEAAGDAQAAVRTYRSAQALGRWAAATRRADPTLVRLDASVPTSIAATVERVVTQQWASLGTTVSAKHAEVFVYFDSTSIARSAESSSRRVLEPRKLVDVVFALPAATDGQRCVALVRLRGSSPTHLTALQSQSLIGVCGFYGAFGLPGAGIEAWLVGSGYRFARQSDWSVARAPATDASSLYTLSEPAGRCLTGDGASCNAALRLTGSATTRPAPSGSRVAWVLDGSASAGGSVSRQLGDAEGELLADAVRSVDPERFARFWQAPSEPNAAFYSATGMRLDAWTQQWLARTYGEPPSRPSARVRDLLWLAVLAPLALAVAARPRQRVLAEWLFART